MLALLKQYAIQVGCKGEVVTLKIGNLEWSLEFDVALKMSALMVYHSRIAKLNAGVRGSGRYTLGVLHDAAAEKPKRKRFIEKLPEFLRCHGIKVESVGQIVNLHLMNTVAGLPFPVAREVSQWLRVRGKEARNNAGEKAHWSEIARVELVDAGGHPW